MKSRSIFRRAQRRLCRAARVDPLVSIVIAAYDASEALRDTLRSLFEHTAIYPFEVIVVDSGASDPDVRKVVRMFAATYRQVPNHGFAAASNAGIREARGAFVVLLNPDVILQHDAIGELVRLLQQNPDIGCAGPRLLRRDGSVQPYAFGSEPAPGYLLWRAFKRLIGGCEHLEVRRPAESAPGMAIGQPIDVDWIAGTCLVARREAFESAGLLDERYFLYWEDVDWCLRLKRQGWRVVLHPLVAITHLGGVTTGGGAATHYYRSLVRFYRKWYGRPAGLLLAVLLQVYAPLAVAVRRRRAHFD